jgi:hypothetical protein
MPDSPVRTLIIKNEKQYTIFGRLLAITRFAKCRVSAAGAFDVSGVCHDKLFKA